MFFKRKLAKKAEKSAAMREANTLDYTKDGKVKIYVGLKYANDFFSPFAYKTYELLNPTVVDYINMSEASIPQSEELSLEIFTEEPTTNTEKKRMRQAVKRHNAEQIVTINRRLKRNLFIGISFCVFGLAIMIMTALFYNKLHKIYIQEILAIVGWMFLWDGLEFILEDRVELKRKKRRCIRLLNAKVHVRQYDRKIQREYGFGEYEEDDEE